MLNEKEATPHSPTPTPWTAEGMAVYAGDTKIAQGLDKGARELWCSHIVRDELEQFLPVEKEAIANAAYIVRAVNAYAPMVEALKEAQKIIGTARQYFPKSIKNADTFSLENTCAGIGKAIVLAEGD
jgi:hypothetical protein